ncbi:MAG: hypothetical protein ACRC6E_00715 [Fusobacteriaceae bacterium]
MNKIEYIEISIDVEKCIINLSNGQFIFLDGMKRLSNNTDNSVIVKSKEVIISGVYTNIKDIIVLTKDTFTTEKGKKYGLVWKINSI